MARPSYVPARKFTANWASAALLGRRIRSLQSCQMGQPIRWLACSQNCRLYPSCHLCLLAFSLASCCYSAGWSSVRLLILPNLGCHHGLLGCSRCLRCCILRSLSLHLRTHLRYHHYCGLRLEYQGLLCLLAIQSRSCGQRSSRLWHWWLLEDLAESLACDGSSLQSCGPELYNACFAWFFQIYDTLES